MPTSHSQIKPNIERLKRECDVEGLITALEWERNTTSVQGNRVRCAAAEALRDIGDARAQAPLIAALRDWEENVHKAPPISEEQSNVTFRSTEVGNILSEEDILIREAAAEGLDRLGWNPGDDETTAWYWVAKRDWDHCAHLGAVAVAPLITALEKGDWLVAWAAAETLGQIGDARAVNPLIAALKERNLPVSLAAADALESIGWEPGKDEDAAWFWLAKGTWDRCSQSGKAAINPLLKALRNNKGYIAESAAAMLDEIGWEPAADKTAAWYWIAKGKWDNCIGIGEAAVMPLIETYIDRYENVPEDLIPTLQAIGRAAVIPLIVALWNESWLVRRLAANMLGKSGDRRAIEPLIVALKDPWYGVRREAVEALRSIGDARSFEPLVAVLEEEPLSGAVANALWAIGKERALEPLFLALKAKDQDVRLSAVMTLAKTEDKRVVEPLIMALGDQDVTVRLAAIDALSAMGDSRALEPLVLSFKDLDYNVRQSAIHAMARFASPPMEPLITALKDNNRNVRESAAQALGRIGDIRAQEPLTVLLADKDRGVADSAVWALDELGWKPGTDRAAAWYWALKREWDKCRRSGREAEAALVHFLRDEDGGIRLSAARGLDRLGWKPGDDETAAWYWIAKKKWRHAGELGEVAIRPFIRLLKDAASDPHTRPLNEDDEEIRDAVSKKLAKIGKPTIIPLIEAVRDRTIGHSVAGIFESIGEPAAKPLVAALKDKDPLVRQIAIEGLGGIGDIRTLAPLIAALQDENSIVRQDAARTLGQMEESASVEPLVLALGHGDIDVRRAAILALERLGDAAGVLPLIDALTQAEVSTCLAAVHALGRIGDERAIAPLVAMMRTGDDSTSECIAEALDMLGWKPANDATAAAYWIARREWDRCVLLDAIAVEPLITALRHERGIVYEGEGVISTLRHIGEPAVAPLIAAIKGGGEIYLVGEALAQIGEPAVGPLIDILIGGDEDERWVAADALGEIGDTRAVEPLITTLKDKKGSIRQVAALSLGKIGDKRASFPLQAALKDRHRGVRQAVQEALARVQSTALNF